MHEAGHSKLVLWDNPERWDGEGGGIEVQDGDTCAPMAASCQHMAKITKIIVIKVFKKIKKIHT